MADLTAIGKLTERSEKPTSKDIRYSLKFQTQDGVRTFSSFHKSASTLEYNHWYEITYYESDNPQGKFPYKNATKFEEVSEPQWGNAPASSSSSRDQGEWRRSKEEVRLLDCLRCACSQTPDQEEAWDLALAYYDRVVQWEIERESTIGQNGHQIDGETPITSERSTTQPTKSAPPRSQPDKHPDREYCQVEGHNQAPLLPITGQGRNGHPFKEGAVTHICYGAP